MSIHKNTHQLNNTFILNLPEVMPPYKRFLRGEITKDLTR